MNGRRVRRGPVLVALALVAAAAVLVADRGAPASAPHAARAGAAPSEPAVPAADALSTSWYCADGTSTADGRADETVVVASLSDRPVDATVAVMQGSNTEPVSHALRLAPHAQEAVRIADLVEAAEPGVVVEVVGGQAVVWHEVVANDDVASEPCVRGASSEWYFAAGTTLKGAAQYLALFNPFGDDAIVDLTFLTDEGVREPDAWQGLVVPRRTRITVAVHDEVPRQRDVALHVTARVGHVVAERTHVFDGTASEGEIARRGIALSRGVESPRHEWYFTGGRAPGEATGVVAIANFGVRPTNVEVSVVPADEPAPPAESVEIPARSVVTVETSAASGSAHAVIVVARDAEGRRSPVVAEYFEWWPDETASTGVATSTGTVRSARRWVVAVPTVGAEGTVAVLNPGRRSATVELAAAGARGASEDLVDAGRIVELDLTELRARAGQVVTVESNQPVVVGIAFTGAGGATVAAAVPDDGDRGGSR